MESGYKGSVTARVSKSNDAESKGEFWLRFILHQFIGVWGITLSAAAVTGLAFDLLMLLGKSYAYNYFYWILSGRPCFPVQITLALVLGWAFGRHFWHRSMIWVWLLPLAILCYAIAAIPTLTRNLPVEFQAGLGQSRFSHYLGRGCGPWNGCLDQAAVTLPFYVAVAYAFGGSLAARFSRRRRTLTTFERAVAFGVGAWFFVAAVCDFYFSTKGGGWHAITISLAMVTAGIGLYLALLALNSPEESQRQQN